VQHEAAAAAAAVVVVVVVVLYYYYIIIIIVVDKHPTWLHPMKALQTKIIAEEVLLPPV
jgi:hypothetical protein